MSGRVLIVDHHDQVRILVCSFLLDEFGGTKELYITLFPAGERSIRLQRTVGRGRVGDLTGKRSTRYHL